MDLTFVVGGKLVYLGAKKGDLIKKGQVIGILDQRSVQKNLESDLRDYSLQRNNFDQTNSNNQNRTPQQALNDDMKRILQNNQYNLDKAVISVELQDLAKQQTVLTSPIDGILLSEDIDVSGVNLTPATSFVVADTKNLKFKIDIDEADIGKVKAGQNVKVTLDAFPNNQLSLPVKSIDFASHTNSTGGNVYTVEVTLPENLNDTYRIGMNGDAEIVTNEVKDVLSIPLSSIDDNGAVYVKSDKVFVKRDIKTGLKNDTDAEVVSGLAENEEVALDPTQAKDLVKK